MIKYVFKTILYLWGKCVKNPRMSVCKYKQCGYKSQHRLVKMVIHTKRKTKHHNLFAFLVLHCVHSCTCKI